MLAPILAGAALLAASVKAETIVDVDPIVFNGKHMFWKTNQTEFFVRGVAYQQDYDGNATFSNEGYIDPLAVLEYCERDIPYLLELRTNVIRTYAVDPTLDHTPCMNAFANAGIYIISDLSDPTLAINRDDPSWNTDLYARYTAVIQDLSQYSNVIGFFAGNEVSNSANTTAASAFVRAAVRDSKAYIAANVDREMYVGYATYDGPIRNQLAEYFNCGDQSDAIDFWGYNVYSWCGASNYVESHYQERTEFLEDYSIPAIFAEYGCDTDGVRIWTEVQALFGYNMTPVWSGGIAYAYFPTNGYGLVTIVSNTSVETGQDFDNLSSQQAMATPSSTAYSAINTGTPFACPSVNSTWEAQASPLSPTPNNATCNCLNAAVSCVVASDVSSDDYGTLFDYICGLGSYCEGIEANATSGSYGAYAMCEPEIQLNYVLDVYYKDNKASVSSACSWSGSATLQSAVTPTGSCASLLAVASTQSPSTVGATGSSSGTKNAAAATGNTFVERGSLYFGLFVVSAVLSGFGAFAL